jgi:hypothetical protein
MNNYTLIYFIIYEGVVQMRKIMTIVITVPKHFFTLHKGRRTNEYLNKAL